MPFAVVIARSMAGESLVLPLPVAPKSRTLSTAAGPTSALAADAAGAVPPTTARAAEAMTNPRRVLFIAFALLCSGLADGQVVQVGSTVRGGGRGANGVVARVQRRGDRRAGPRVPVGRRV